MERRKEMSKREIIEFAIADMISEKVVGIGECIPSIRKMAQLYGVSATPVIEAYRNLECCGLIESRHKSCFIAVSDNVSLLSGYIQKKQEASFEAEKSGEKTEPSPPIEPEEKAVEFDFGKTAFECPIQNKEILAQCISKTLKNSPETLGIDPYGYDDPSLVDSLSQYLLHNRFIVSKKEISIVNNDISTAFILAIQSCSRRDQTILLTAPCAEVHKYAAKISGRKCIHIPSSFNQCVDLDMLEYLVGQDEKIACIIVAPNYMMPSGAIMSDEDKRRLVDICQARNIAIIEDDSCGDLYFSGQCPRTLKSMAAEQTIYISTFTTSVSSGIPVHWACPGKYSESFRYYRNNISSMPPVFLQNSFAMYMRSRYFKKHMQSLRELMRESVEAVRLAVNRSFPEASHVSKPGGGFWLYIELPRTVNSEKLEEKALESGISYYTCGGRDDPLKENCISLNCSVVAGSPGKIRGVYELGKIVKELCDEKEYIAQIG